MAKFTVKAHELKDVNVNYISLVKRGANRIPFRVMKGDQAVLDLDSFFFRKSEADVAEKVSKQKSEDMIKAATDILLKAGYTVGKSEPASDGTPNAADGLKDIKNPAADKDAGGKRNDGTSGLPDDGKNPTVDTDAGGPRNDGGATDLPPSRTTKTEDVEKAEAAAKAEADAKAALEKAAKEKEAADKKKAELENDENEDEALKKEKEVAKKAEELRKAEADKAAELRKAEMDSFREMFATMESNLKDFVKKSVDEVRTEVKADVSKTESAINGKLSALVPGQNAADDTRSIAKSDNSYPLLDTGFGHNT